MGTAVASCVQTSVSLQIMAGEVPSAGEGGGGVPKWVIGVAIGVPVAAALGYILFGPSGEPKKKPKSKKTGQVEQTKQEVKSHEKDSKPVEEVQPKNEESKSVKSDQVLIEDVPEEPTDPLEKAVAAKNRGNKYFRGGRYELAIKCYSEAIDICPKDKPIDLATFHQNRAAAHDQLNDLEAVIEDCDTAVNLNNKYVKALDRRAKSLRKQ